MKEITLRDVQRAGVEVTLKKGAQLLDPVSGIIRSIMPNWIEQGAALIQVFGAVACQANPISQAPQINRTGGASIYRENAIAATIGESVERYCSAYYEPENLIFASYKEVESDAVHPEQFGLYSERQYRTPGFPFVPFTTSARINWTWGYSLQQKRRVLVPACLTYLPYRSDERHKEVSITTTTSTGLACGNTLEEAILSGIGEVVERDALTCFWLNRLPLPQVEVDKASPIYDVFKEKLDLAGLRYHLCDATTDLGIPVFFTLLVGDSNVGRMVNAGSQANLSAHNAALKSMVEAAHGRPYVRYIIQQNPNWKYSPDFSTVRSFQDHAAFYTRAPQHFDALDFVTKAGPSRLLSEVKDLSTGSVRGDIELCLSKLADKGIDLIVVDLTTPDIEEVGLKVARVIAPGLQLIHGDHRYRFQGCSRLYKVPESLGYRSGPVDEAELNPYPHPLP
ncbi:MAG TPA: YcaO-like family protein [Blastocatellia bacterium]|nr:YcaO-like family protein [Blastocatellia bacterium]